MDTISKKHRSWNMSRIKGENTSIEQIVRKTIFAKGYRYRINVKGLPGRPDIVLPKYRAVIFVNGCFWHGHSKCKAGRLPKTHKAYWQHKIRNNIERDKKNVRQLRKTDWRVKTVWECQIKKDISKVLRRIETFLCVV